MLEAVTRGDLLRLTAVGSIDDGKSTLVGRLLYDTNAILADQLAHLEAASERLGERRVNLALLTDGLRAEREQRITIDVAYRYFATARRTFIIADTPGHLQYTRNMVTGASTADLALILLDATKGVTTQSRRHAFIASLLAIPHVIVVVNKMDLAGYSEAVYSRIRAEFRAFAAKLPVQDVSFIPVCALEGDNVVEPSARMPWYQDGPLLRRLETVTVGARPHTTAFRFPVQHVIRSGEFRGYAGTVAGGAIGAGDAVVVLPSGFSTRVRSIETFGGAAEEACAGDAVVLTTDDALDISRGDMIVAADNGPTIANWIDADLCWMDAVPARPGARYLLMHTTRQVPACLDRLDYRIDVDTMQRTGCEALGLNDIGGVRITLVQPLFVDAYRVNCATGSFILIDSHTNATVAAGMIRGEPTEVPGFHGDPPVTGDRARLAAIPRRDREARNRHRAAVIWLTGLPGAGKTTIARLVERRLYDRGCYTVVLDGDEVRQGLCADLGFSPEDRAENIRRAGEVAALLFEQGCLVLCAFVSPYRGDRDRVRALLPAGCFVEVWMRADLETLRSRDPKALYARAQRGEVADFTGISAPYEPPLSPELVIDTTVEGERVCADTLIACLEERGIFEV